MEEGEGVEKMRGREKGKNLLREAVGGRCLLLCTMLYRSCACYQATWKLRDRGIQAGGITNVVEHH
jgi:hypothetical protein